MHDIRTIRDDPQGFDHALGRRGLAPTADSILAVDERRKTAIASLQVLQEKRNALSKEVGQAKAAKDEARAAALMAEVASIKDAMQAAEEAQKRAIAELDTLLAAIPNLPLAEVPDGPDESANVEHHRFGERRHYDFTPRQHFEIGEELGQMDFETAAKLSGSRFVVLRGRLARLERAIGQFMLDTHTQHHGYTEVSPPLLVNDGAMFGTAQLPKFYDDQFAVSDNKWLIPTAEVPLTNLVRELVLPEEALPLRFTALTPCFRREAGAAGRDTRGMLRQHQFSKVELVSITTPEASRDEHERMLFCAETVLKALELHYRVVTLCTGDMGFASQKTYDIEVWLPGQEAYREISSCSVCGDFQARRMNARYRPNDEKPDGSPSPGQNLQSQRPQSKGPRFVHTLNGSGTAVGRALIAVLETWQNGDGSVTVPPALRPYMGGVETIEAVA